MGVTVIQPRTWLPLSLGEIKAHLRFDHLSGEDDALLTQYQEAALATWGDESGSHNWAITAQRIRVGLPGWPLGQQEFKLPWPPLRALVQVDYVDPDGVTQTLDPATYELDKISQPARLRLAPGQSWPPLADRMTPVSLTLDVGYADLSEVPAPIKQALLLTIEAWHPRPDSASQAILMDRAGALMSQYRVHSW